MTTITLIGRATEDPGLRFTSSGKAVATLNVADNHRRKDRDQWVDDGTTFYRVTAWEHLAEQMAEQVRRGQRVIVVGELRNREYEARDGSKARSLEIRAYEVGPALDKYPPRDGGASRPAARGDAWGASSEEAPF